ncbi:MAG TPA: pyridoxamine 5'-phosphate oxidase family protein [Mycobacteriales bacterium]|nr:pyridoxamine 5'-phosphate oxidase family protein [Mycobacteriales bacterium]
MSELSSTDHAVLDRAECLRLLATAAVGRIVFTERALPAVIPVSYGLDGERIVIKTSAGSAVVGAGRHAIVAFQVDELDRGSHTGWSVVATGPARLCIDQVEIAHLDRLPLPAWTPGHGERYLLIEPELFTGRMLRAEATGVFRP